MTVTKEYKRIQDLELMLYNIKGKSNKHDERKVIMAELNEIGKKIKKR